MTWKVAPCFVALILLAGCGDSLGGSGLRRDASDPSTRDGSTDQDDGGVVASCDGAPEGTPCGTPGAGTHCILELCVKNSCGDGVRAGTEQCDDGNEADGDSCDLHCIRGSGGSRMDAGAASDGGPSEATLTDSGAGSDSATGMDTGAEAGPGTDGAAADTGAQGEAGADAEPSGPHIDKAACLECAKDRCTDVLGVDVYAGCFTAIDPQFEADPSDPTFIQACVDTVQCAVVRNCGFTTQFQAADCYCGSNSGDCTTAGPALDAPCLAQWRAATRVSGDEQDPARPTAKEILDDNAAVQLRFSDLKYPAGWAYNVVDCMRDKCRADACRVIDPSAGGAGDAGQTDAGPDAAAEAGAPEAGPPNPACIQCAAQKCRDSLGLDVYAGCYLAPDPQFAPPGDATFLQECQATVACAVRNQCGFDAQLTPAECYCGSNSGDACTTTGPAPNAPCLSEWRAAVRTNDNAAAQVRFVDHAYPAAWAYFLLECMRDECGPTCHPEVP